MAPPEREADIDIPSVRPSLDAAASRFALECGLDVALGRAKPRSCDTAGGSAPLRGGRHSRPARFARSHARPDRGRCAKAAVNAKRRTLVFLGDYVDRGPDSRGVVETLIGGLPQGFETHFLKGNHEAILLNFLDDRLDARSLADEWRRCDDALLRRRHRSARPARRAQPSYGARRCKRRCPRRILRSTGSLKLSVAFGDYLFVHAGVKPGRAARARRPKPI